MYNHINAYIWKDIEIIEFMVWSIIKHLETRWLHRWLQEKLRLREAAPELTAAELLATEAERLEEDQLWRMVVKHHVGGFNGGWNGGLMVV